MLAVQVSLESLAAEDPGVSPDGTHDAEGLVERIVNFEDDEGDEVVDVKLFHDIIGLLLDDFVSHVTIEPISTCEDRGKDYPAKEPGIEAVYKSHLRGLPKVDQETHLGEDYKSPEAHDSDTKDRIKSVLFHF